MSADKAFVEARRFALNRYRQLSIEIKNANNKRNKDLLSYNQKGVAKLLAEIHSEAGKMYIKDDFAKGYRVLNMVRGYAQISGDNNIAISAENVIAKSLQAKEEQAKSIADLKKQEEVRKDIKVLDEKLKEDKIAIQKAIELKNNKLADLEKIKNDLELEIQEKENNLEESAYRISALKRDSIANTSTLKTKELEIENSTREKLILWIIVFALTIISIALWKLAKDRKKLKQANADIKKHALEKIKLAKDLEEKVLQLQNTLQQKTLVLEENIQVKTQLEENKKESARSYDDLIRAVAHSFKNKISPLKQDFFNLFKFLRKIYGEQAVLDLAKFVRKPSPSEPTEDVDTYERLCNRIDKQLEVLPKIFNDFQVLQKDVLELQTIDLNVFFEEIKNLYSGRNYRIDIIPAEKPLLVKLDKDAFLSVVDNLVINAVKHGFKENSRFYEIDFILSEEEMINGKQVKILYKDNGVGFPENYDINKYKTFGDKSVFSKGSGIGGYVVSKIVSLHNGKIALLPVPKSDQFRTQIQILLPLHTLKKQKIWHKS